MTTRLTVANRHDVERILVIELLGERYRLPAKSVATITSEHDFGNMEIEFEPGEYITVWIMGGPDYDDTRIVSVDGVRLDWL